jgi:tRNA A37 threonylcarbamoyltransferase TsaD
MHNVKTIGIGGGVAANALLQHKIKNIAGANVYITSRKYCGDNAAMIGFYVSLLLQKS